MKALLAPALTVFLLGPASLLNANAQTNQAPNTSNATSMPETEAFFKRRNQEEARRRSEFKETKESFREVQERQARAFAEHRKGKTFCLPLGDFVEPGKCPQRAPNP